MTIAVREYLDAKGESPFADWFAGLDALAAAKVATLLYRLEQGNFYREKLQIPLNPPLLKGDFNTPLWKRGAGGIFHCRG
jgi:hypothetical protein